MGHVTGRVRISTSGLGVVAGAGLGFLAAFLGTLAWNARARTAGPSAALTRGAQSEVDLFRLPSSEHREMVLLPAGPDADGEPGLAKALFPDETPPRELASLLLANVSSADPWLVDFDAQQLRCRRAGDDAWTAITGVASTAASVPLSASELLRLRGLGSASGKLTVEPRSLRHVLLALPPKCRLEDLSDVQWDGTPLLRDRLDVERIRRLREDPAAVTTGR